MANNEIRVMTWEDCQAKIREIKAAHQGLTSGLWFRGQSDAEWRLETTLERRSGQTFKFLDYYKLVRRIKPEIESVLGMKWETIDFRDIFEWTKKHDESHFGVLAYEYLAHLRHNGFPSPLLDWSHSPYVAAYFAVSGKQKTDAAIYVYLESSNGLTSRGSDRPAIRTLGPYVATHRRHFRQQSRYTICAKYDAHDGWGFAPHEAVFNQRSKRQDLLWKIVIPSTERIKIISWLEEVNVNAYSLFGSDESLMETLAYREIDLKSLGMI